MVSDARKYGELGLVAMIVVLAVAIIMVVGCSRSSEDQVPLAAVFAGWYGHDAISGECVGGLGSTHWNDSPETGGVVYTPVLGFYCSSDPKVVAWQLDQMQKAGISVIFYSWWGWGDGNLDGVVEGHADQHINLALTEMLRQIRDSRSKMKVALIVEPFTVTQGGVQHLTEFQGRLVLDYVWERYYEQYPDQVFQWQGSPLLVTFDPMVLPNDGRYTIKRWTGRPKDRDTIEEGWQWFFAPPQGVIEGMSDDGVVFVYPRFDETYLAQGGAAYITWSPRIVDPCLQDGAYERQWQELTQNRTKVHLIVLYSWNLYGEQAHIEPSYGKPAPVGHDYVAKTRKYYDQFLDAGIATSRHPGTGDVIKRIPPSWYPSSDISWRVYCRKPCILWDLPLCGR